MRPDTLAFDPRPVACDAPRFAYVDLVRNLVVKEIRIRYMGAWLGFAWSLANPLLTTLVYYVVFTFIMPTGQPRYALYIVAGVVHWGLLTQLIGRSGDWFIDNSALLRKMRFPHLLIPLANFLAGLSFWLVALVIFFALFPLLQGQWHPALLLYPLYLIVFVAMIGGLCLVMSVAQVFFRDTKHLADVTLGILFWMTPIVYRIDGVPPEVGQFIRWNPVVPFFNCFHAMLYDGVWPTMSDTLQSIAWAVVSLGAGLWCYRAQRDRLVERL